MHAPFTPSEPELWPDDAAIMWVFLLWYDGYPQRLLDADEYLNKPSQKNSFRSMTQTFHAGFLVLQISLI